MGAALTLPFTRVGDVPAAMPRLRDHGLRLLALTPQESARALSEVAAAMSADSRVALLLGAEGAGLSAEARAAADDRVRIPIAPGVDSLNVVVAAGIALHALAARHG